MRLPLAFLLLCILFCFPQNLVGNGDAQQEREWGRVIRQALHHLKSPRYTDRLQGVRSLQALPDKADPLIIERLDDTLGERPYVLVLTALVNKKSHEAPRLIVKAIPELPHYQDGMLIRLLQACNPAGYEALYGALFSAPVDPLLDERNPRLEKVFKEYIETEVLDHLFYCMKVYKRGYFRTMWHPMWKYRDFALSELELIVTKSKRSPRFLQGFDWKEARVLAAQGILDWPSKPEGYTTRLGELYVQATAQRSMNWATGHDPVLDYLTYALHASGVPQEQIVTKIETAEKVIRRELETKDWDDAIYQLSRLAYLYVDLRDHANAFKAFNRCISVFMQAGEPESEKVKMGLVWYNLACVRALEGKPERAVAALRVAYKCGWQDFEWMWRDGDLESVWGHEVWRNWVEELRDDEVARHQLPLWEPGHPPVD